MKKLNVILIIIFLPIISFTQSSDSTSSNTSIRIFSDYFYGQGDSINNQREGEWTLFVGKDNRKYAVGNYKNGLKHGLWKTYLSTGRIRTHGIYENGKIKEYTLFTYVGDSSLYLNSKSNIDLYTTNFIDSCSFYLYINMVNDIIQGRYGSSEAPYIKTYDYLAALLFKNENDVEMKYWGDRGRLLCKKVIDSNGIKNYVYNYKNFKLSEIQFYFNDVLLSEKGVGGSTTNYEFYYYANGNIKQERFYTTEIPKKKTGKWMTYFENGNKKAIVPYWNDELNGTLKIWDSEGKLIKQEKYKKGQLVSKK